MKDCGVTHRWDEASVMIIKHLFNPRDVDILLNVVCQILCLRHPRRNWNKFDRLSFNGMLSILGICVGEDEFFLNGWMKMKLLIPCISMGLYKV